MNPKLKKRKPLECGLDVVVRIRLDGSIIAFVQAQSILYGFHVGKERGKQKGNRKGTRK